MIYRELFEKVGIDLDAAKARLCTADVLNRPGHLPRNPDARSYSPDPQLWQSMRLTSTLCTPDTDIIEARYIPTPKEMVKTANALASIAKAGVGIPYYFHNNELLILDESEFEDFMSRRVIRLDGPYHGVAGDRVKFYANLMHCVYEAVIKNNYDRLHKSFYIKRYPKFTLPTNRAKTRTKEYGYLVHTATRHRLMCAPNILNQVLSYMEESHYRHTGSVSSDQVTRKISGIAADFHYLAGKVSSLVPGKYARAIRDPEYRDQLENDIYLTD